MNTTNTTNTTNTPTRRVREATGLVHDSLGNLYGRVIGYVTTETANGHELDAYLVGDTPGDGAQYLYATEVADDGWRVELGAVAL